MNSARILKTINSVVEVFQPQLDVATPITEEKIEEMRRGRYKAYKHNPEALANVIRKHRLEDGQVVGNKLLRVAVDRKYRNLSNNVVSVIECTGAYEDEIDKFIGCEFLRYQGNIPVLAGANYPSASNEEVATSGECNFDKS